MHKHSGKALIQGFICSGLATGFGLNAAIAAACCNLDDLEGSQVQEIATATFNTYSSLLAIGCTDSDREETADCNGGVFTTWTNVRSLIHTANEIAGGNGPTEFSLGTDLDGLAEAFKWNAGEEFSSHETMMTGFGNSQQSTVSTRISALRSGASGFSFNNGAQPQYANLNDIALPASGLNAGDQNWSQLGGFLNVSYRDGNLDPSDREDAFDFEGFDINAGLDYRINEQWVAGGLVAYARDEVDFDASLSIVDGKVEMTGIGLTAFLLFQNDAWYYTASAGYQRSTFDTERSIRYTSLNLAIPSPNTVAISSNDANTLSASMSGGYTFQVSDAFTIEPSAGVNYSDLTIEKFTERDKNNLGFNLSVAEQNYASMEIYAALKAQYVFSTSYGVFIPFIDLQNINQYYTDARTIEAVYGNIAGTVSTDAHMKLLTDNLDSEYRIISVGVSSVLRGASQKTLDGPASGGIQAFLKISEILDAGNYHQSIIAGGLRYEF